MNGGAQEQAPASPVDMQAVEDWLADYVRAAADERHALRKDDPTTRPLSDDYQHVGMAGEFALGRLLGLHPDLTRRDHGDGGVDFKIALGYTIDCKAFRDPLNLLVEKGRVRADIYVLAEYHDDTKRATAIAWEWGKKVKRAPTRDFGHGIVNHYIARGKLRPLSELLCRLVKI